MVNRAAIELMEGSFERGYPSNNGQEDTAFSNRMGSPIPQDTSLSFEVYWIAKW